MIPNANFRRFSDQPLELGLFAFNVQNGMARLKETVWNATWDENVALARLAEDTGLEFLLPLGIWRSRRSFPDEADDAGGSFETLTWASAIMASTNRIAVFGTLHVAYINPVFAAKQIVTAHHIGRGRFGLNIVSANRPPDFALMGLPPSDHDASYDYTEEWLTIAKRLWREAAPFDHDGPFFHLRGAISKPKPYGGEYPMLISAGHSHRGRAFAMEHTDALFTSITELENAPQELEMARTSHPSGREIPIYGSSHLVCRPTRAEADDYYHYVVYELGDWQGINESVESGMRNRVMPYASMERYKERQISGVGTFLIKGSYDDVAHTFKQLHEAGFDGMAVGMIDYLKETTILRDEIMPRLERLGLRRARGGAPTPP
jgi:FMNH2-dependent dimethyl sulfone monooxygenase